MSDVISDIMTIVNATFEIAINPLASYHEPTSTSTSSLSLNLPVVHGKANYKIGSSSPSQDDDCHKATFGHPHSHLAPLLYTLLMVSAVDSKSCRCKSPKIPSDIFTSRFYTQQRVIVSDNACKLQAYCLNHEPRLNPKHVFFFFFFYRLLSLVYWHVGCSSSCCLDSYKSMDIHDINSQVNEHANSGL